MPSLLLAAALVLHPTDDAPAGDLGLLQGSWRAEVGPTGEVAVTLAIAGDRFEQVVETAATASFTYRGRLRLDESADPRRLDWVEVVGPGGEPVPDAPALYRIDGDALTICSAAPGGALPDAFTAGRGRFPSLRTYRRVAEESEDNSDLAGDLLAMQGDWTAAVGPNGAMKASLSIEGRTARFILLGPEGQEMVAASGRVRLDESASPKAMDWLPEGDDAGRPVLSIYELDGPSLRISLGIARRGGPVPRPEAFTEDIRTITLTRAAAETGDDQPSDNR